MNYFNYAIKCVIRNIIYKLMKPRNLIIVLTSIIIIFLLSQYTSVFGWEGDNTYTDKNNTIIAQYDSINQDLVNRIKYFNGNSDNIDNLIDIFRNNNYNYYIFYGSSNGSSMDSGSYFSTNNLYIYFYDRENFGSSGSSLETYQGMTTNYRYISSGLGSAFVFTGNNISTWTIEEFHIPTVLINYKSSILYDFINSEDEEQTNSIVGAINQQTNSINQQTNTIQEQTTVIQETQDFITDDNVSTSEMTIDNNYTINDNGVDNFFTSFLDTVKNAYINIDNNVETIDIYLPPIDKTITLRSDLLSSHINNTYLFILIQSFWWFIFARYIIGFAKRMIDWLSTGEILSNEKRCIWLYRMA